MILLSDEERERERLFERERERENEGESKRCEGGHLQVPVKKFLAIKVIRL